MPSDKTSFKPSAQPSNDPSTNPSSMPSSIPSNKPSNIPSSELTLLPSSKPSNHRCGETTHIRENIALCGTATQISNCFDNSYLASTAIDGNRTNFAHTNRNTNDPWWQVQWNNHYLIDEVRVHNVDDDCCSSRLVDFVLTIEKDGQIVYTSTVTDPSESSENKPIYSYLNLGIIGDTVKIQLFKNEYMNLAEVQVLARSPHNLTVCSNIPSKVPSSVHHNIFIK